jgi:hypothetical protein
MCYCTKTNCLNTPDMHGGGEKCILFFESLKGKDQKNWVDLNRPLSCND